MGIPEKVKGLLGLQFIVALTLCAVTALLNPDWLISVAIGASALIVPSAVMAFFAFRRHKKSSGGELLRSLIVGEIIKIMLVAAIFIFGLTRVESFYPFAMFAGYLGTLLGGISLNVVFGKKLQH